MCKNISIKHLGVLLLLPVLACTVAFAWHCLSRPLRYAVFAGYNADGTIHPYILTYLKGLNEIADGVVYIADSPLSPGEEEKLKDLVIHTEHQRHEEYDWGSYKRGFNWLKNNGYLDNADELIFANDSCYAPMQSFKPMFEDMAKHPELDFWGNSRNNTINPHLQSYFLVFRKRLLRSKAFATFINRIAHQKQYEMYIVEYETKLTRHLQNLGYKWDSWLPYSDIPFTNKEYTDVNNYPLMMLRDYNNQFLKRRTFTSRLTILDDRSKLLRLIKQKYPARYEDIQSEISPRFIHDDLKEKR